MIVLNVDNLQKHSWIKTPEEGIRARRIEVILSDYIDTFEVGPITSGTGIKTRSGVEASRLSRTSSCESR